MVYIAVDSHPQRSCQSFEYAFNLVVFVLSFCLNVEVHLRCIAETLEEVEEHLGGHLANAFATELGIPDKPGAAAEIERGLTEAVVHGQAEAVALDASFVAERFEQAFAECNSRVFYGVVFVDM